MRVAQEFDIRVAIRPPSALEVSGSPGERSAAVRERVVAARTCQAHRIGWGADANVDERPGSTLRVARTIADLEGAEVVRSRHAEEALFLCSGIV